MTDRARFFEYIGDASALLCGYKWVLVERYHYATQSGHQLVPQEGLGFYVRDHIFYRSFYAPRVKDVPGVHGPFAADQLSSLGVSAYERLSLPEFRSLVEQTFAENFGNKEDRTNAEQRRFTNAERLLREITSSDIEAVFRLRTEDIGALKHDSAFIFDYYAEFVLIDSVAGELQTCVIAAD